jgi:anaerobic selenocysteine-containing dehydrogenase
MARTVHRTCLLPLEVSDEMRPGVVSIPHGFGTVARAWAGASPPTMSTRLALGAEQQIQALTNA